MELFCIVLAIFAIWFVPRFCNPNKENELDRIDKMNAEAKMYQLREGRQK